MLFRKVVRVCIERADITGDGRLDLVTTAYRDHTVLWYENRIGLEDGSSP